MTEATEKVQAIGRRKCASCRITLVPGTGKITVNKVDYKKYFPTATQQSYATQPLVLTGTTAEYDITANISGGGIEGQAGALRHGIARALQIAKPDLHTTLKAAGMVTRDPREKERKKPGRPGARKRFQFSKR